MSNYRRMWSVAVLSLIGFLLGFSVQASEGPVLGSVIAHVTVRHQDIPVYQLTQIEAANTPQGMDGFAEKVAVFLHTWTRAHGVEASGNICRSKDKSSWGVVLLTIGAHTSSPITNVCPDGMTKTGVTIHSHPQRHIYTVNFVDRAFLINGLMAESKIATYPDEYSGDDLNAGPGYLVGLRSLHFQDGHDHQRVVENLL